MEEATTKDPRGAARGGALKITFRYCPISSINVAVYDESAWKPLVYYTYYFFSLIVVVGFNKQNAIVFKN